jgi:hypothetical protein
MAISPLLQTALPSLPAVSPLTGKRRTRDLIESDPKRAAHLIRDDQFEHFLALVADGVNVLEACSAAKMTRVGLEHALRTNDAAKSRFEEAKLQALYKEIDIGSVEAVLLEIMDGKYLKDVLADRMIPQAKWYQLILKDPLVKEMYEEATRVRSEIWGERLMAVSEDDSNDVLESETEHGIERRANNAAVQRHRLMSDNMKFLMSRLHPDRFGDKQKIDLNANITIDYAGRLEAARRRRQHEIIKPSE